MKSVNIRSLKHDTGQVLRRVGLGESIIIRRRNQPLALLKPLEPADENAVVPDFRQRLHDVYGDAELKTTATDVLSEERGDR